MAEKLTYSPEQHHAGPEHHKPNAEKGPQKSHSHEHHERISDIRDSAAEHSRSAEELKPAAEDSRSHRPTEAFINNELKDMAYARTLKRTRQQLRPVSKTLSRVIHQPVVDAISEAAAKTIARPSGILGGGIIALAGTTTYYYISKHFGYDYNFFIFLLLLIAGFVTGWLCELVLRAMRGRR